MFDMGFLEFLLIGIIALIVLGPERLPKAARTVGLWIGKAKQGFDSIKTEIDRELKVKELQQQIADQKAKLEQEFDVTSDVKSIKDDVSQTVNSIHSEVSSLGKEFDQSSLDTVEEQSMSNAQTEETDQLENKK